MSTSTSSKMTYVDALTSAINGEMTPEVIEKLVALRTSIEKRKTTSRKPSKKQVANGDVRSALVAYINDAPAWPQAAGFLVGDLIAGCGAAEGKTTQYVSAILRQAYLAKEISKSVVGRKTYYIPFDPSLEIEG